MNNNNQFKIMKKNFLAVAIALIGTCMAVSAQTPSNTTDNTTNTEQTTSKNQKKNKNDKSNKKDRREFDKRPNPFEGIELTAQQQEAIKNLRQEQMAQAQAQREKAKTDREAAKVEREQAMKEMDDKIKNILTAEQYTQYQQNIEKMKAERGNRPQNGQRGPRNMRRGGGHRNTNFGNGQFDEFEN